MGINFYGAVALATGEQGSLDYYDGANLNDRDFAVTCVPGDKTYFHTLDVDSGAATSSPDVIPPRTNAGNKRWLLLTVAATSDINDHVRSHALTGTSDHTSTATSGRLLKANAFGLPENATNTDTEVASAVSLRHANTLDHANTTDHSNTLDHTQGTDTALGAIGTKNPPIDADLAIYRNSAASNVLVTSTWTQVKAFLKTYFDTLYGTTGSSHTQGTDTALGTLGTKNPPIDADKLPYRDSTASDALVTSTWTQIKAFLKTYFDTRHGTAVRDSGQGSVLNATYGTEAAPLASLDIPIVINHYTDNTSPNPVSTPIYITTNCPNSDGGTGFLLNNIGGADGMTLAVGSATVGPCALGVLINHETDVHDQYGIAMLNRHGRSIIIQSKGTGEAIEIRREANGSETDSVNAATTGNITLANNQTIDGIAVVNPNRVLVKSQTAPAENGIYTVVNAGAWTRTTDADAWTEFVGMYVSCNAGTANGYTGWKCTVAAGGTLGVTAITFTECTAKSGAHIFVNESVLGDHGHLIALKVDLHANIHAAARIIEVNKNGVLMFAVYADGSTYMNTLTINSGNIVFPATQVPNADSNVLDDYEENTWTPDLQFGGAKVGITYTVQGGKYTKIGNKVTVTGTITLSSNGSSTGAATIAGLPFSIPNVVGAAAPCSILTSGMTFANQASALIPANSSVISLYEMTEAGALSTIADTDISDTAQIYISATYLV
jgi:hypothetical protein